MKLTDTIEAAIILIAFSVAMFFVLLGIPDPRYSMFLAAILCLALFLIAYSSWLIRKARDDAEKRMQRYIEAAYKTLRREMEREVRR